MLKWNPENQVTHDSFSRSSKIEDTPDDFDKHVFRNFKTACEHYRFRGSHQHGSTFDSDGVIRTYSNSTPGKDIVLKGGREIHYRLKSKVIMLKFLRNIETGQRVHFFRRVVLDKNRATGCKDMGLFEVVEFLKDGAFVKLVQFDESERPALTPGAKLEKVQAPPGELSTRPPKKQKK